MIQGEINNVKEEKRKPRKKVGCGMHGNTFTKHKIAVSVQEEVTSVYSSYFKSESPRIEIHFLLVPNRRKMMIDTKQYLEVLRSGNYGDSSRSFLHTDNKYNFFRKRGRNNKPVCLGFVKSTTKNVFDNLSQVL